MQLQLSAAPHACTEAGTPVPLAPRDAALLAWLAIEGATPRGRLAALLWPDSAPELARNGLRQRLFHLKKQCGDDLVVGRATLSLGPGVRHDLEGAATLLQGAALEIKGELLAWLEMQRARLDHGRRDALARRADAAEQAQRWLEALALARALLERDPLSEAAHRRLIRLLYLSGDRAAAMLAFDRCEWVLKHEVGVAPSTETLQLLRLMQAGAAPPPPPPAPGAVTASLCRPPQVVGRDAELRQLQAAWQDRRPFLLIGEPGQGKSRLLQTLARTWPDTLTVAARPGDAEVPLSLLWRLLQSLAAHRPGWVRCEPVQALCASLGPGSAQPPHPEAMPEPVPDASIVASPGAMPRPVPCPVRPLFQQALQAWGESPPALLLDDWQFADDASVQLLADVLGRPPLSTWCVGVASRAGVQAEARLERLRAGLGHELRTLRLAPLHEAAVVALVESLHLELADAPALARALHRRVGGNPLLVLETLRHQLLSGQALVPADLAVPPQVRDLVVQRLAELPERARQLLYVAAVAQPGFSVELAQHVTGRDALELLDAWQVLERHGLFGAQGIAHDVHAEAVLSQLPAPIACVLHKRVATFLEGQPHEPARLARHWLAAGDDQRAVAPLVAAARRAWHTACADECKALYAQAADIEARAGQADRAFELWFDNADAMSEIGTPAQLEACLQALRPLAHDETQGLRLRLVQAVLSAMRGQAEQAAQALSAMLADAIALRDARVECECRFAIASRACADGRFDEALQHLAAGERLMRDSGDSRRASAMSATMTLVLGLRGQARLAAQAQTHVLPQLQAQGDQATWAVVCASRALQHMRQGELDAAMADARQALARVELTSIAAPDLGIVLRALIETWRWSPHLGDTLQVADALRQRLAALGSAERAFEPLAVLYLQLGRADLAQPLLHGLVQAERVRSRERLRLQLLQLQQQWTLAPAGTAAPDWPAQVLDGDDLALAAEWALWSGLADDPPWDHRHLAALAGRCADAGLRLLHAALQALQGWRAVQHGVRGAPLPAQATDLAGLHGATPWVALFAGQAWQALERPDLAQPVLQAGLAWLRDTVRPTLPEAFRTSYLQRQPMHRQLAAVAAGTYRPAPARQSQATTR